MKLYQKLLILMITIALILAGATACGRGQTSQEKDSETSGKVNKTIKNEEESPPAEKNKKDDREDSSYTGLLNKAMNIDNFYSEFTEWMIMGTVEKKVWMQEDKVKICEIYPEGSLEVYYDLAKGEAINNSGFKVELSDTEIEHLRIMIFWFGPFIELFSQPGLVNIEASEEKDLHGIPCVYLELKTFENELIKLFISKEYGITMKYEHYSKSGEKVSEYARQLFETGTVTDKEVEIPEVVNIE